MTNRRGWKDVRRNGSIGLRKDAIRRIALEKLEVVYRDWNVTGSPFADFATEAGERREDARAFLIALVAGLLGGLSEAIDRNNEVIAAALTPQGRGRGRRDAGAVRRLRAPRGRGGQCPRAG